MTGRAHFERGANDVGASARGHNFVTGGDKRRAHDRRVFAAAGAAVALLEIADEGTVFEGKRESRLEWQLERPRKILAQMIVDLVPAVIEDFSGIENVF